MSAAHWALGAQSETRLRYRKPPNDYRITSQEMVLDQVADVANFRIIANINGKRTRTNLLQANMLTLSMAGAAGDKPSARAYILKT